MKRIEETWASKSANPVKPGRVKPQVETILVVPLTTDEERAIARERVMEYAKDPQDAERLLAMLDLVDA